MGGFVSNETARWLDRSKHSASPQQSTQERTQTSVALRVLVVTSVENETAVPYKYKASVKTGQYDGSGQDAISYASGVDLWSNDKLSVGDLVHASFSHGNHWESIVKPNRIGYCWILSGTSGVAIDADPWSPFAGLFKYPCKASPFLEQYSPQGDSFVISNRIVEGFKDTPIGATWNGDAWIADGFFSVPIVYYAKMRGRLRKISLSQGSHSIASDVDTGDVAVNFSNSGGLCRYVSSDNLSGFSPLPGFQHSGMVSMWMNSISVPFGINYGGGTATYECSMSELLSGTMKYSMFTERDSGSASSSFSIYNRSIHISSINPL